MEPENINTPKSKKGLYIVIAIIVILVLLFISKKSDSVVPGGDLDRNIDGSTTYSNEQGSVTVGSNKLPDNWPSDAPKYSNATIQYSGTTNPQTGEEGSVVVFMTSDKLQTVVDFYKKELAGKGWTLEQIVTVGVSTVIPAKKDTRTFGVYITDAGNGQVNVSVGIVIPK